MIRRPNSAWLPPGLPAVLCVVSVALLLMFSVSGCKTKSHTSDARLKKIDDMLNTQLPQGTSKDRVEYFLTSRGYRVEDSRDKFSVVAVVRHIDTETLQPATARVTFHFDPNGKLLSYELQPVSDVPLQP